MAKKLEYQTLLDEQDLTVEELPIEIRKRINVLRPLIAKFNTNPSEKMKQSIIKNDVEIAELIADHIEKDLPESNNNDDDDSKGNKSQKTEAEIEVEIEAKLKAKADAEAKAKSEADTANDYEKKKSEEEAVEKAKAEEAAADASKIKITEFGTLDMEKKIIENCGKNNGFITEKDLVSIIGESADYPSQKVYSISLKKVFLKSLYELQS